MRREICKECSLPGIPLSHDRLRLLYQSMKRAGTTRQQFDIRVHGRSGASVTFNVVFLAESLNKEPWKLLLGCRPPYQRYERVKVYPPFQIYQGDLKPDFMHWLRETLGVRGNSEEPFTGEAFLRNELIAKTPIAVRRSNVRPSDVPIHPSEIEEADKVYFLRWLPHSDMRHVSEDNLRKTGVLISKEFENICRKHNISTCWSADPRDEKEIVRPPLRSARTGKRINGESETAAKEQTSTRHGSPVDPAEISQLESLLPTRRPQTTDIPKIEEPVVLSLQDGRLARQDQEAGPFKTLMFKLKKNVAKLLGR